jgi:N-acetylmuramoyl-L-alanine amidase
MLKQIIVKQNISTFQSISRLRLTKKRIYSVFLVIPLTLFFTHLEVFAQNNDKFVVVVDAGHGGYDPGTKGKLSQEKNITLAIALKIQKLILANSPDTKVILTRSTDYFIPLHERAKIANKNNANLFISIHVDGVKNKLITGTSTFVMGLHKTDENFEVAKRENSVISIEEDYSTHYENFDPNSAESYIIFSLLQNKYLEQSLSLASKIQNRFREKIKRDDRGVKQAGFLVLWKTTMPSVLVETGFLTNPDEEQYLISETGQQNIAESIYMAFNDFKNEIKNRTSFTVINQTGQNIEQQDTSKKEEQKVINDISISNDSSLFRSKEIKGSELSSSENLKTGKTEIYFKVQVASFQKKVSTDPENFKNLKGVEENNIEGVYKYTIGNETDYNEAVKSLNKIKKVIPGAFIIAIKNGKKITVKDALLEIKSYKTQ